MYLCIKVGSVLNPRQTINRIMRKKSLFFAVMALMVIATGCRRVSETENTEEKEITAQVGSFDRIHIQTACDLTFEIADSSKLTMSGSAAVVDDVILDKQDGCLVIKQSGKRVFRNHNLKIKVSSPVLKGIDHDGAGSVCLNGEIKSDSMALNLTGVGSIEAERIICGNLSVHDNGTGSVTLKAVTADDASLFLNGVGSMDANFISSGSLNCVMDGVGSIDLKGQVKSFSKSVSGVGNIEAGLLKVGE